MTLAPQIIVAMKRLIRIAPFLIVLALGIELLPRVQAVESKVYFSQEPIKVKTKTGFHGIVILPNPAEQLLYSQSMNSAGNYHPEMEIYSDKEEKKEMESENENAESKTYSTEKNSSCYANYSNGLKCEQQEKTF